MLRIESAEKPQRLPRRDLVRQRRALQRDTEFALCGARVAAGIDAAYLQVSTVGLTEAQQTFQCRGLPGPVRPQKSENFAGRHGKAHASHRFGAAVAFAQIAHDDVIGHWVKRASAGIQRHGRLLQLQLAGIPFYHDRPLMSAGTQRGVNRARNR